MVKRMGRWGSDAVERYMWDLSLLTEGTAEAVLLADTTCLGELSGRRSSARRLRSPGRPETRRMTGRRRSRRDPCDEAVP